MSNTESILLEVIPISSRYLRIVFIFLHGFAALVILGLPLDLRIAFALEMLILLSLLWAFTCHVWRIGRFAISKVFLSAENSWILIKGNGQSCTASLCHSHLNSPKLIILNFRMGGFFTRSMILPVDGIDKESARQIRLYLHRLDVKPSDAKTIDGA